LGKKHFGGFEGRGTRIYNCEEFLTGLKKEFGRGDNEIMKIAELKKMK